MSQGRSSPGLCRTITHQSRSHTTGPEASAQPDVGPVGGYHHGAAIHGDVDLSARVQPNSVADVLWDHHLAFRSNPMSHTPSV